MSEDTYQRLPWYDHDDHDDPDYLNDHDDWKCIFPKCILQKCIFWRSTFRNCIFQRFLASQDALEVMRVTHSLTYSLSKRSHWLYWCDPGEWWYLKKTLLMWSWLLWLTMKACISQNCIFWKCIFWKCIFLKCIFFKVYFTKTFLTQSFPSLNFFKLSVPGEVRVFRALRACFWGF